MESPFQYYHTTYGSVEGSSPKRMCATASPVCYRFDGVLTPLRRPERLTPLRREPGPANRHVGFGSRMPLRYDAPRPYRG
ncbi:hypothetical protein [Streptomyces sp. NPDC093261]|uniref:hypothetical protein n=1 Tax=Streptomyces sp. NPDC093261 TaxID=3366037 RepID=UPI00380D2100